MNQLAMAIRNLSEGRKVLEPCCLTTLELIALKSIGNLVNMSPVVLTTHLQQEDGPTEWLNSQYVYPSAKAID